MEMMESDGRGVGMGGSFSREDVICPKLNTITIPVWQINMPNRAVGKFELRIEKK